MAAERDDKRHDASPLTEHEIMVLREEMLSDDGFLPEGKERVARLCDMALASIAPSAELPIMKFSGVNDPTDWSPHAEFDSLTFGSYTDAKKAEVLFNRLIRELNEAAAAIEKAESEKNWLRAQRDVAEEKLGVPSATASISGMPMIKTLKDQRDEVADVLRRLMHKLREDSGSTDPMDAFAYDASWEALAKEADAILAKCPSYTQQMHNLAKGLGMTYDELVAGIDRATKHATDRTIHPEKP